MSSDIVEAGKKATKPKKEKKASRGVIKRGDRYYIRFIDGDNQRKMIAAKLPDGSPATTEKEAAHALQDAKSAVRNGKLVAKAKLTEQEKRRATITIREISERFVVEGRPQTKKGYALTARVIKFFRMGAKSLLKQHVLDRIGDRPAASIAAGDIEKLRDDVLESISPNTGGPYGHDTAAKVMTMLSSTYTFARRAKLIDCANPVAGVGRPKAAVGEPGYLTAKEGGEVIAWTATNGDFMRHVMVTLALNSGMRKGEMFGLTWDCINLDAGRLLVKRSYDSQPKGGRERPIALHPSAVSVLRRWRQECPTTPMGLVFPVSTGRKGGWRMGRESDMVGIGEAFLAVLGSVRKRPWHLLRHSCASNLAQAGASPFAIQKLLGHSTPMMTQRYAHLSPEFMKAEIGRLTFPAPPPSASVTDLATEREQRAATAAKDTFMDTAATNSIEIIETKGA